MQIQLVDDPERQNAMRTAEFLGLPCSDPCQPRRLRGTRVVLRIATLRTILEKEMSLPVIWDDPPDERDDAVVLHYWAGKYNIFYCYEVVVEEACVTVVEQRRSFL